MQIANSKIRPCLWFDSEAEEAARFYVSLFPNSRMGAISRYAEAGAEIHGRRPGSVMAVDFELDGRPFAGLNGGPVFKFTEAVSFQIRCDSQEEIDRYWTSLAEGGEEGPCGWVKDRFGLSWQVTPVVLFDMLLDPDRAKVERVTGAYMKMKKFDIAALQEAYRG